MTATTAALGVPRPPSQKPPVGALVRITSGPYLNQHGAVGRVLVSHHPDYVRVSLINRDDVVFLDLRPDEITWGGQTA